MPCDDPEWSNFTKFFAQNFQRLGLKKLISTSYALESKTYKINYQPSLFETDDPQYDKTKTKKNGKIFILTKDKTKDGKINIEDLEWSYLEGDGDFRSNEVRKLRDEADIIITNPPFSLFREFLAWIVETKKLFVIIGNMNAITYKEVFPLIKENKIWLGNNQTGKGNSMTFKDIDQNNVDVPSKWFTNIDHGRRHQLLPLMTMVDNIKFSKHKEVRGKEYAHYDNYEAIEVPYTDAIPSDYKGVMGVPISFLTKYNPEQFKLLGIMNTGEENEGIRHKGTLHGRPIVDGVEKYLRILIKNKK